MECPRLYPHPAASKIRNRAPELDDGTCPRQRFQEAGCANKIKPCEPRFVCKMILIVLAIQVAEVLIVGSAWCLWTLREERLKLQKENNELEGKIRRLANDISTYQMKTSKLEQDLRIERESWHIGSALGILVVGVLGVLMAMLIILGCVKLWDGK